MNEDLARWLLMRIAEDEQIAKDAIEERYPGYRWHWVTTETDTPVKPGDEDEAIQHQWLSLRTVEEFPSTVGPLPGFVIHEVQEGIGPALRHIAHWDPERVLAQCETNRHLVLLALELDKGFDWRTAHTVLRRLAQPYRDRPGFRPEWRIS